MAWVVATHRVAPRPPLKAFTGHNRGKFYSKNYRMGQRDGTKVKVLLYLQLMLNLYLGTLMAP